MSSPECQGVLEAAISAKPNVKDIDAAAVTIAKGLAHGMAEPITLEDKLREREDWIQQNTTPPPQTVWGPEYNQMWEKLR